MQAKRFNRLRFRFRFVGDKGPDGGLEEPVRDMADVEGGGHGLRERNGEPVGVEGRIVRAEVDRLVRNRGSAEAGGEIIRAVEIAP